MEPVVSNEKTISLTSAPSDALAFAAGFDFFTGEEAFSSSIPSSTDIAGF